MDLLRRHLSLVIASLITLAGTVLLSVFLWRASRELKVKKQKLLEIKLNKEKVQKFQWELNSATRELAEANLRTAARKYVELLQEIAARYPAAESEDMGRIACSDRVKSACGALRERLYARGVAFSQDVGRMTLQSVIDADSPPKAEDVPLVIKQLNVVDELVTVVARSGIPELNSFTRNDPGLQLQKGPSGQYNFSEYGLTVTGDFNTIRNFLNNLNDARYLYVVRHIKLAAQDVAKSIGSGRAVQKNPTPGGGSNPMEFPGAGIPGGGTTKIKEKKDKEKKEEKKEEEANLAEQFKENRIVFKDLSQISVSVTVDYVEFVEDKTARSVAGIATPKPAVTPATVPAGTKPGTTGGKAPAPTDAKPPAADSTKTTEPAGAKTGGGLFPPAPAKDKAAATPEPEQPREETK